MKIRNFIAAASVGFCALFGAAAAYAQSYPEKPIRIVVPYPPGGSADSIARQLGTHLNRLLKQQVIVDNKPGGSSVIAAQTVASSTADGYTLLISDPTALSVNPSLFRKLSYGLKDFQPIGLVASFPFVLLVNDSSAARTVGDFVEMARKRDMSYASPGTGTPVQLATELFKDAAGIQLTHIPYKGAAPAFNDLMGGQIDLMFTDLASGMPFIKSGKVRALAITGAERVVSLSTVPTLAESGYPALKLGAWYGISAPKGTPATVVATLNSAIREAVNSPDFGKWLKSQNFEPSTTTPLEFLEIIQADAKQWGGTIQRLGIKGD